MNQKVFIKEITADVYLRAGMYFENTTENRITLYEKGYEHFNWETKEGKYVEIVSSDCYLIVDEPIS